ncbi:biotinidase-like [Stegodyphus dumicola]|uniref:biotinidase-like n=1 Tax=Stegodyphus dumicola TaxID=202533 RepID=UPI0015AA440F|nr:biotinidase-like [Stegodyphus dumicola]
MFIIVNRWGASLTLPAAILCAVFYWFSFHNSNYTVTVLDDAFQWNITEDTSKIIAQNLAFYKIATAVAKMKGADIIVFPEYGILPPLTRKKLKPYLEVIPDPKEVKINPCNERREYQNRPILYTLSCMAQQNEVAIVANLGAIQTCGGEDRCPEDGSFYFNTNVVFDKNGTLLVRYYKEYLFYEIDMHLPIQPQNSVFKTDFGIFDTFICFNFEFAKMAEVIQREDSEEVALSTKVNASLHMPLVEIWESQPQENSGTLLVGNIQLPGYLAVGNGIFSGANGPLAYRFDPDGVSKLVVATIPRRVYSSTVSSPSGSITQFTLNSTEGSENDGSNISKICSWRALGEAKGIYKDNKCHETSTSNNFFVKLINDSDHIKACINGVCCSLKYSSSGMAENFYLITYNGTIDYYSHYSICEQTCILARCEPNGTNPCAFFPLKSKTLFYNVQLTTYFSSKYIYPSVVSNDMRLTSLNKWNYGVHQTSSSDIYKGYINFKSTSGEALTFAGLRSRCRDRNLPYIF